VEVGAIGAGGSDIVEPGVVRTGSSGALLIEVASISLSSIGAASASETCTVFEPIKLMSVSSPNGPDRGSSPYHLPR